MYFRYPLLVLIFSVMLTAGNCAQHFDSTNRIGVLCIGDTSFGESPILGWLSLDFAIQWQELPTDVGFLSASEAKKITRIYTPRTLERLLDEYDILLLLEPRMEWFSGKEMNRFRDSVDAGVSSMLTLWPDIEGYYSLTQSPLAEVFPQKFTQIFKKPELAPFKVDVVEDNPPVFTMFVPLGIEKIQGEKARAMYPKAGSTTWAWAIKPSFSNVPKEEFVISWTYGENDAENWVIGIDADESWFRRRNDNEYGGDLMLNMIYYSVGKDLPSNIFLIHDLRDSFNNYNIEKNLIYSMIDFVDSFGTSTGELEEEIAQADDGRSIARDLYLEGEYEASLEEIQDMIDKLSELNKKAIEMKENALFWVYLTEWTAVTGTAILAGFVIYSLMVKRRLYSEVSMTKMKEN